MASVRITRKAGTTEPETMTVKDADGAVDLSNVSYGQWKMWPRGATGLTIDPAANGASTDGPGFSITDAAGGKVELDPDGAKKGGGNAFDTAGTYHLLLFLGFTDSDEERWPDSGYVIINLEEAGP